MHLVVISKFFLRSAMCSKLMPFVYMYICVWIFECLIVYGSHKVFCWSSQNCGFNLSISWCCCLLPRISLLCLMGHNILNWIINLLLLYLFSCHLLHSQKLPDGAIIGLPDVHPGGGRVVGVCMACVGQPQVRQVRGSSSEEAAGAGSKHAH